MNEQKVHVQYKESHGVYETTLILLYAVQALDTELICNLCISCFDCTSSRVLRWINVVKSGAKENMLKNALSGNLFHCKITILIR